MYYLQSRYYNPEWGRFINADTFVSTGQGLLGNNMFAYCGNNPIYYVDETGEYYTPGQIHDFVVEHICKRDDGLTNKGTYIQYRIPIFRNKSNKKRGKLSTYGFCDFYNSKTGEAWEVKRFGGGPTCGLASATAQLANYVINGYLRNNPDFELKFGGTHTRIPNGYFFKRDSDGEGTYIIYYWDAGDGIVFYNYIYSPSASELRVAAGICLFAAIGIGICVTGGLGAGALGGLPAIAIGFV